MPLPEVMLVSRLVSASDAHTSASARASCSLHTHVALSELAAESALIAVHAAVAAASAASTQCPPLSNLELKLRSALQCAAGAQANALATATSVSTTVSMSGIAFRPVAAIASARSLCSASANAPNTSAVATRQSSDAFFSFFSVN